MSDESKPHAPAKLWDGPLLGYLSLGVVAAHKGEFGFILLVYIIPAGLVVFFAIIAVFDWAIEVLADSRLTRYSPGDTFETHECIICKHDPDASYCIPNPKGKL